NNMGQHIAIIADGMGGHKAGDVASQMAVAKVKEKWDDIDQTQTSKDAEAWLIEGVSEANEAIYHHSLEDKTCEGMGTTLV
ncbi:protein phosphatase, partial [Salmonella enterica subsp. enterica serovar Typhimurium]